MPTLRAAVLLPAVALALRVAGFRRVAPRYLAAGGGVRVDEPRAAAIARAVHRAARVYRPSPSCLTRAIAIGSLLSREGLEARVTIGVAPDPFAAHAWLEHGSLMLAGAAPARTYAPLCRIEAGAAPAFTAVS
ncbi:MAG: lasso peptide biosynthesis B2 protein [Acidobacteriota bacterium]|nr:lasso peptide biosynthesis B2 protein [Acidobacteriota bacterium]